MSTSTALAEFINAWCDDILLNDLGPRLTCREADALIDLFRVNGDDGAADCLLASHRDGDVEGDSHYQPRCSADRLSGTGFGICDTLLDEHGVCPNAARHVETLASGDIVGNRI